MAKRGLIRWDDLTVEDIAEIIAHFAQMEAEYRAMPDTKLAQMCLPTVRARQAFWSEMALCVSRGERIASQVQAQIAYCHSAEYC